MQTAVFSEILKKYPVMLYLTGPASEPGKIDELKYTVEIIK